jgi:hypothetical protein
MRTLAPARAEPFAVAWETIELPCQPMPTREQFEAALAARRAFIEELKDDPAATWFCGINVPDQMSVPD